MIGDSEAFIRSHTVPRAVPTPPKSGSRPPTRSRRQGLAHLADYQVRTTRELEDFEIKKTGVWTLPEARARNE